MRELLRCLGLVLLMLSASAAGQELKLATLAPDGSSWMNELRAAAGEVERETEGRVRVRFYPGGVMGDAATVMRRMRVGQLQGGAFAMSDLASVSAETQLYGQPFLFHDEEEFLAVREAFDPLILEALSAGGLVAPAISAGGFAYLFSRHPIPEPDRTGTDFRVWVTPGDLPARRVLEAAGVSPVPLSLAEVYTALQTGTLNTFASTPAGAIILQWHTRARYLLDLPVVMTAGTVAFDQRAINRLSDPDRVVVKDAFGQALKRLEQGNRAENEQARAALAGQGIEITAPSPAQAEGWRVLADQVRGELVAEGRLSLDHLEALSLELEALRNAQ